MRPFREFAHELLEVLRPHLDEDDMRWVHDFQSVGEYNPLAVALIQVAANTGIALPPALHTEIRERIVDHISFQPRVAEMLEVTCRDRLVRGPAAA